MNLGQHAANVPCIDALKTHRGFMRIASFASGEYQTIYSHPHHLNATFVSYAWHVRTSGQIAL